MARNLRRSDCCIHNALNILGDRWTLIIVRDLLLSQRATYSELLKSPERIATNTLANRLAKLESAGIIEQEQNDTRYWLTEKGLELAPVLLELAIWSERHDDSVAAAPREILKNYRENRITLSKISK